MIYRTQCPHCASVFRLRDDQLDAAQGWAQCSVCGAAFDTRLHLAQEDGTPLPRLPVAESPPLAAPVSAPLPDETPAPETLAAAASDAAESAIAEAAPEPVPAAHTPQGITQREAPLELPSIIIIDPNAPEADDPGPLPHIFNVGGYPAEPAAAPAPPRAPLAPSAPAARIEYAETQPASRYTQRRRRVHPWVWGVASLLLLLVLIAQTAYFMRDTVVRLLPEARPLAETLCRHTGCVLNLPQNLAMLKVLGSDLQTEAAGQLRLTVTLGNLADHVQAWPVLVLTLTDQKNQPLTRRSFAPSEYLENAERVAAGMPPASEQALNLALTARNITPLGFDLQLRY